MEGGRGEGGGRSRKGREKGEGRGSYKPGLANGIFKTAPFMT